MDHVRASTSLPDEGKPTVAREIVEAALLPSRLGSPKDEHAFNCLSA